MGRSNSQTAFGSNRARKASETTGWKRQRPTRHQAPPPTLPNIDVHGILFAVVAVVFVVYPLAQLAFSLGEQ